MEVFKSIKGYEGCYEISNYGTVRSLDRIINYKNSRTVRQTGVILKPFIKKNGYLQVTLYKNMKKKHYYLHRLVGIAFIDNDNPEIKVEINHINEIKNDNFATNLEWATSSQNKRHNNMHIRRAKNTDFAKGAEKRKIPIVATDIKTGEQTYFKSAIDAERAMGFSHQHIAKVCRNKLLSHKGHTFKYA